MSNAAHATPHSTTQPTSPAIEGHPAENAGASAPVTPDAIDAVAHAAPIILPIVGGVLMFLLAFIAIFMA